MVSQLGIGKPLSLDPIDDFEGSLLDLVPAPFHIGVAARVLLLTQCVIGRRRAVKGIAVDYGMIRILEVSGAGEPREIHTAWPSGGQHRSLFRRRVAYGSRDQRVRKAGIDPDHLLVRRRLCIELAAEP